MKSGATLPAWVCALKDKFGTPEEEAFDLTPYVGGGKSIKFAMREKGKPGAPLVYADLTVVGDPKDGVVAYEWQPEDTAGEGDYDAEVVCDDGEGGIEKIPNKRGEYFSVIIGDDLED